MTHETRTLAHRPAASLRKLAIAGSWLVLLFCNYARAETPPAFDFKIAPQALASALVEFSQQAEVQVVGAAAAIGSIRTEGVTGHFTGAEALERLLRGTELAARWKGLHTVTIAPAVKSSNVAAVRFEISARNLDDALTEFGMQSGLKVTASPDLTRGKRSKALRGTMPAADGLRRMLRGTGLTFASGGDGGITIQASTALTLAGAADNEGPVSADVSVQSQKVTQVYQVGGNVDIPRTIDDVQPYYIFDSKTIEQSGAANIEDFLKQRLTMNTVAQTNGQASSPNSTGLGNTSTINLRGVGTDHTLILVDGRRMPGVNIGNRSDNQPDINGIPLSAIDRIEVLPSSASGIYGGSAIGGVVNIVLKKNYTGGEINATYDGTWGTSDDSQRKISASFGTTLEEGKTHVTANASWSDGTPLLLRDRAAIYERNLAGILSRGPNLIYSSTNPWLGVLPNIASADGSYNANFTVFTPAPLVLNNGTSLGSTRTFVPAGTSPATPAATVAAGLLSNAGRWNFNFPESTQSPSGLLAPIGVTAEAKSVMVNISREMLPGVQLFADLSLTDNQSRSIYNPLGNGALYVPAGAPINPFTGDVYVQVPDATEIPYTSLSQNRSATVGALVQLPRGWTGEADYTWSENRFRNLYYNIDSEGMYLDASSGALNPFVDTLKYPLGLQKYIAPASFEDSNHLSDVALRASGPLAALPWGTPSLTLGLEHIVALTPARTAYQTNPSSTANNNVDTFYEQASKTDSVYLEGKVPLVKEDWLPGVHALELQLAGRGDRYRVSTGTDYALDYYDGTPPRIVYGGTTLNGQPYFSQTSYTSKDYTLGLKYQPLKELTLRVSRATAFLPPTPDQLIENPQTDNQTGNGLTQVIDPKTGNIVSVDTRSGGNPNLKPQSSKSTNLGIIWEPHWRRFEGLRLNAEYYKIEQYNAIGNLSAQQIVNEASIYPGRVVRDSSGMITLVDISSLNLFYLDTEGWDLSADDSVKTGVGEFSLHAVESIIQHLRTQYAQATPEYEAAGYSPLEGGAPKYKSNATLTWAWREWTAGWTAHYFSSYKQSGAAGGPIATQNGGHPYPFYFPAQGGDTIPSQMYHDLFVSYAVGSHAASPVLRGLTFRLGVRNVFDKVPPLDVAFNNNYYLSPYGDARLRSYWLNFKKGF